MNVIAAVEDCGFCPGPAPVTLPAWLPVVTPIIGGAAVVFLLLAASILVLRDRAVPDWFVPSAAFAFGISMSLSVMFWAGADTGTLVASIAAVAIAPLIAAWFRRFGLAGWSLVGACLPAVLWWGSFIVQDLATQSIAYADDLLAWFAAAAGVAALGLVGVAVGDGVPGQLRAQPPDEPDPGRVTAVATAYLRARRVGTLDLPNALALGLAGAASAGTMTLLSIMGVDAPWPSLAGVALFVVLGTELFYRLEPRRLGAAWATHAFVGSPELRRFRREVGGAMPTSAAEASEWLRRNPETDSNRWIRPELLAWTGAIHEAYEAIDRMPETTQLERFERRANQALVDLVAGRPADVAGLEAMAEAVGPPGSDDRMRALAIAALTRARERVVYNGDWIGPLLDAQGYLGHRALGIYRSDTWLPRFRALASVGAFIALITVLPAIFR